MLLGNIKHTFWRQRCGVLQGTSGQDGNQTESAGLLLQGIPRSDQDPGAITDSTRPRGLLSTVLFAGPSFIDRSYDDRIPLEWRSQLVELNCVDDQFVGVGTGQSEIVILGRVFGESATAAVKVTKRKQQKTEILNEIAVLEKARSPYIVRTLAYTVRRSGQRQLATEYMQAGSLYHALRRGDELQWYNRGRQAFVDICKGLSALHSNLICHSNLNSENVLINTAGTCKISSLRSGHFTKTETSLDSMPDLGASGPYMAPERTQWQAGLASDIWSLSITLWEICTLKLPTREAREADILVPTQAPQAVADLMAACHRDNPRDRPTIFEILGVLDSLDSNADHVAVQM